MYVQYPLSLGNVEGLIFERGYDLCRETVHMWWNRFGPMFASQIRKKRVSCMRGLLQWVARRDVREGECEMVCLWRAVDHEGEILQSFVTKTRDKAAALAFMTNALERHGSRDATTTDDLRSYTAAMTELGNADKQEIGRWANNRVKNSQLPF